jgi:hypothetical protein
MHDCNWAGNIPLGVKLVVFRPKDHKFAMGQFCLVGDLRGSRNASVFSSQAGAH